MNFMDYCFIAILILSGLAGAYQGLVRSVVGLLAVFFTYFVSITQYPKVAYSLKVNTPIYDALKKATEKTISSQDIASSGLDKLTGLNDTIVNSLLGKVSVPPVIRDLLIRKIHLDLGHINTSQLIETMSTRAADIFINVFAFILIFAALQFLFVIIQNGLGALFSMPILNEVNIIGGFGIGVIQGIITLFVICAGWSLFSGATMYKEVFVDLNASKYAKIFYEHNLLLDLLVRYIK